MVWHVVDSYLAFIDEHDEWTDTRAVFDITGDVHGTTLHFTHEGLTAAESACFESCSRGWTFYITQPWCGQCSRDATERRCRRGHGGTSRDGTHVRPAARELHVGSRRC